MTYVQQTVENAAIGIAVVDDPTRFDVLRRPGVAAAIWRRQLPPDFQHWIDTLAHENLPSARIVVGTDVLGDAVTAICDKAGLPENPHRNILADDVVMLARQFASMMDIRFVRLRFDVIGDDACRKFHIDSVTARLVCTYRGPGTQYGISVDGNDPKRVFSVPTGAPMLLRGTTWPDPPRSGLLHRSPQIEGTGVTRLVLVIAPADDMAIATG